MIGRSANWLQLTRIAMEGHLYKGIRAITEASVMVEIEKIQRSEVNRVGL